jgi:hypothetical protein
MIKIPFIDIHTHHEIVESETIVVHNIFPGDGFAAFTGRNFYSVGLHPWYLKTPGENNEMLQMVQMHLSSIMFVLLENVASIKKLILILRNKYGFSKLRLLLLKSIDGR